MIFRRLLACVLALMLLAGCACAQESVTLPEVEFYGSFHIGHLERESSVAVQCNNPAAVSQDNNVFELRNQDGVVLATREWKSPAYRLVFNFYPPEEALGANDLSVWWNGYCVTEETAYLAVSDLSVKRVTQLEPEVPAISLTIVCGGGGEKRVDEILAVLDKYGVKCTFFLCGGWLENHVEEARRLVEAGHEIGSHGYDHVDMTKMTDYRAMRKVITEMNTRCEELLGVRPRLFRAPYSYTNQYVTALARAEGMEDIKWNIDSCDWSDDYKDRPRAIISRVTGKDLVSGSVIQFHLDGHHTVEVLDEVIPYYLNECGYQVVTVGELMELSGHPLPPLPDEEQAETGEAPAA